MSDKDHIHIKYNSLCYYCICQACNLVRCPFSHGHFKSRFDVCMRCLASPDPHPRLDCDFFMHKRKKSVFRVTPYHFKKIDDSDRLFVIIKNGKVYGPYNFKEARRVFRLIGGIIRELSNYD